jgi:hypothetical protein
MKNNNTVSKNLVYPIGIITNGIFAFNIVFKSSISGRKQYAFLCTLCTISIYAFMQGVITLSYFELRNTANAIEKTLQLQSKTAMA